MTMKEIVEQYLAGKMDLMVFLEECKKVSFTFHPGKIKRSNAK